MKSREDLVQQLRAPEDWIIDDGSNRWLIAMEKGELRCDVTVPKDCFEWFVSVKRLGSEEELWSDWDEYYGAPKDQLEAQIAKGIADFLTRARHADFNEPIRMHEDLA